MEKKTIGAFIAVLRKANGMTQKDLAERLNVSDKTVSRWERDDGAPDLSLVPVIAEIFGVTCDELLRGERKIPEEKTDLQEKCEASPKGEKQRQRMLKATLSQYRTQTYIAIGVSTVGFIAALICNLAFLKAVLGFLCGAIFFAASIVCQVVLMNRAFLSVEDAELEETDLSAFRKKIILLAEKSIGVTIGFIGFTFPMILVDAHLGLSADGMLLFGIIGAAVFLLIDAVICHFLNASFINRGTWTLNEKEAAVYRRNCKLKRISALALMMLLAATWIGQQAATEIYGPMSIVEGTVFNDYESFIAFMELDISCDPCGADMQIANSNSETVGDIIYYDALGNEISEDEALHRTLEDVNGEVVCEYIHRNEEVYSLQYAPKDGSALPITVCTYSDLQEAENKVAARNVIFSVAYFVEAAAVILFYFLKRAK